MGVFGLCHVRSTLLLVVVHSQGDSSPVTSSLVPTVSSFPAAECPIIWGPALDRSEGGSMDEMLRRLTQFSHCAG